MNISNNSEPLSLAVIFLGDYEKKMFGLYQWTGVATMISNLLVVIIFVKDKVLRHRYLFIVLAMGDFINGVYFAYGGFARLREMSLGTYYTPISNWDCAMKFYSFFQLVGTQWPAVVAVFISFERVLAVQAPVWYYANFGRKYRISLVLLSILICVITLSIYYLTTYPLQKKTVPWGYCPLVYSSCIPYHVSHEVYIVLLQTIAFLFSAIAYTKAKLKSRVLASMINETVSIKPILAFSAISFILLTIPQTCLLLKLPGSPLYDFITRQMLYVILLVECISSFLNFFIFFFMSDEFQQQVLSVFLRCKHPKGNSVIPRAAGLEGIHVHETNVKRID